MEKKMDPTLVCGYCTGIGIVGNMGIYVGFPYSLLSPSKLATSRLLGSWGFGVCAAPHS